MPKQDYLDRINNKSSADAYKTRIKQKNAQNVYEQISRDMGNLSSITGSLYNDTYNRYKDGNDTYRADSKNWLNRTTADSTRFQASSSEISSLLDEYDGILDPEWASNVRKAMDSYSEGIKKITESAQQEDGFWSNFKDEAEYTDYRNKATADLDALGKEIDDLEATYQKANEYAHGRVNQTYWAKLLTDKGYSGDTEGLNKLQADIAEKKAFRNSASVYQGKGESADLAKLVEEAKKNPDFAKYSAEGANIENPSYNEAQPSSIFRRSQEVNNPVTFSRGNTEAYAISGGQYAPNAYNHDYQFMTEDEVDAYNYYLAAEKAGLVEAGTADNFLKEAEEVLNQRSAEDLIRRTPNNLLGDLLVGMYAGGEQFTSGIEGIKRFITDSGEYAEAAPISKGEFALSAWEQNLPDNGWGKVRKGVADLTSTITNQIPSIMTSTILSAVASPAVGETVGAALMGAGAAGNAYNEFVRQGYSTKQARLYGTLIGVSETCLEKAIGGISAFGAGGAKISDRIVEQICKGVSSANARIAIQFGGHVAAEMISEGIEEFTQDVLEPYFQALVKGGKPEAVDWEQAAYSGLLGALSAGLMNGTQGAIKTVDTVSNARNINGTTLKNLVIENFSEDSLARQYAMELGDNPTTWQKAKLLYEVENGFEGDMVSDLENELIKQGVDRATAHKQAQDIGTALTSGRDITLPDEETANAVDALSTSILARLSARNSIGELTFAGSIDAKTIAPRILELTKPTDTAFDIANTIRKQGATVSDEFANDIKQNLVNVGVMEADAETMVNEFRKASVSDTDVNKDALSVPDLLDRAVMDALVGNITESERIKADIDKVNNETKEVAATTESPSPTNEEVTQDTEDKDPEAVKKLISELGISPEWENAINMRYETMDNLNGRAYLAGLRNSYWEGYNQQDITKSEDEFVARLTETERKNLAEEGAKAREKADNESNRQTKAKPKKGSVRGYNVTVKELQESFNKNQKSAFRIITAVAQAKGINIVLYDSRSGNVPPELAESNGAYSASTRTLYLDISAGVRPNDVGNLANYTLIQTFSHELVHALEHDSPSAYREFQRFIFAKMTERGTDVSKLIEKKQADYGGIDPDIAAREVVAESMVNILSEEKVLQELYNNHLKIFQKIFKALQDFLNDLKEYFERTFKHGNTPEAQAIMDGIHYVDGVVDEFIKLMNAETETETSAEEAIDRAEELSVAEIRAKESLLNDLRKQLKLVDPIEPSTGKWARGLTTEEVQAIYPQLWNVAADESEDRNPTQITSTVSTYRKIYDILKAEDFDGTVLDASSGLGYGTRAGREEYGYDVDDIEPYPAESYKPRYKDYSKLDKTYDAIISNAVLNVLPQEQRDALVVKMGEMLNPGGRMFINVRSKAEIQNLQKAVDKKTGKPKNIVLSDTEVAETTHGSYQKGFTNAELKAYLEDVLGDGYTVEGTSKFGGTSVIVTKGASEFHTEAQQKVIDEYNRAVDPTLKRLAENGGKTANGKFVRYTIGKVSERQATDLKKLTGRDYTGYVNAINTNGIQHIENRHGANGQADHSMEDSRDVARMAYVLDNYDSIQYDAADVTSVFANADQTPAKVVKYGKRIDGTYYVVEAVPETRYKKLWVVTAYKTKRGVITQSSDATNPEDTSKTTDASLTPSNSIAQAEDSRQEDTPADLQRQLRAMDTEYLELAKDPEKNEEKLSKMVEEAARANGYDSPKLYHGTNAFGFTVIDNNAPGADGFSFWTASKPEMSGTYALNDKTRRISRTELSYDEIDAISEEAYKKLDDATLRFRWAIDRIFSPWVFGQTDNSYLREKVRDANPEPGNGDGVYDVLFDVVYEAFHDGYGEYNEDNDFDEWIEESEEGRELINAIEDVESAKAKAGEIDRTDDLGGVYELYANTDNLFEVDCEGRLWKDLRPKGLPKRSTAWSDDAPYKTRDVVAWARDNGYSGVHFINIRDNGQYGRTPAGDVYAFFNPQSQVKSADPVTYDSNGNIIPLSERFNSSNTDLRYQRKVTPEEDAEYLEMAKKPEKNEAKLSKIIEEAARANGYDSPKLYHGTSAFGFTKVDVKQSDDRISFFATDNEKVAKSYVSQATDVRKISDGGRRKSLFDSGNYKSVNKLLEKWFRLDPDWRDPDSRLFKEKRFEDAQEQVDDEIYAISVAVGIEHNTSLAEDLLWSYDIDEAKEMFDEFIRKLDERLDGEFRGGNGIYQLYANTDGLLEIDGEGANWNHIPLGKIDRDFNLMRKVSLTYATTRQIAKYAKEVGYSGVLFKNIRDTGFAGGYTDVSNIYAFFKPKAQVKSADPITYDSDGNIIPLSERFNPKNNDLRYQRKVPEITTDEYKAMEKHFGTTSNFEVAGYLLTDGKMLDFSGRHDGAPANTNYRTVDHRDINEVLEGRGRVDGMIDMIGNGNIRLMPETGGINLAVMPNEAQENVLRRYVRHFGGEVMIDFDEVGGDTVYSKYYEKGTSPNAVLEDVRDYFRNGARPRSELMQFHEQRRNDWRLGDWEILSRAAENLEGNKYTEEQKKALTFFQSRLNALQLLQKRSEDLWEQYRDQLKAKDRKAADKTLAQRRTIKLKIEQAADEVTKATEPKVVRDLLKEARDVIETQEREHGAEVLRRYRDRRDNSEAIAKYKKRVLKDSHELQKWITNPDDKAAKRVPDVIKNSVIDFLSLINETSTSALKGKAATQADYKFAERLRNLRDAIKTQVKDLDGLYSGYTDLPEDFFDEMEYFINMVGSLTNHTDEFVINAMTSDELKRLSATITAIKHYVQLMNAFQANAIYQHVFDAGDDTISYLEQMKKAGFTERGIFNYFTWTQMRPAYAWARFGKGGLAIFDELRRAQDTLAFNAAEIIEFTKKLYTDKEVNEWTKETKTFDIGGDKVEVPVSFIMSLYELMKQEDSRRHIETNGLRFAAYSKGARKIADEGHVATYDKVMEIVDSLTDRQKEVADGLQRFMATRGAEWGNYVSMKRFGREAFSNLRYFPISSDGRYLESSGEEKPNNASLYALLNMSFTKARNPHANNRLVVYDIFDVFANHMASMAQYNAFALPILDALKWLNYSTTDMQGNPLSIKDEMARVYGTPTEGRPGKGSAGYAERFVTNILKAFNGTETQANPTDNAGLNLLRRYNQAQIAFNFRVVVQQPMAIVRAASILPGVTLAKGALKNLKSLKANIEEMQKYSGIAKLKSLGYYDTNVSPGLTKQIKHDENFLDKAGDIGMKPAEFADDVTWAAIWVASKEQAKGDIEKAVEIFEDVIYKTQVVDSVLTKTEFMRNKGGIARILSSFMSEPVTTASMMVDSIEKFNRDRKSGMSQQELWRRHGKNFARVTAVYAVNAIVLAVAEAALDALRDDSDDPYLKKYGEKFWENFLDEISPFAKYPIIKDIEEMVKGFLKIFGLDTYGYQPRTITGQGIEQFLKGTQIIVDKIDGQKKGYTWYAGIYKLLQGLSGLTGTHFGTITREVITTWNTLVGGMNPSLKVRSYVSNDDLSGMIFRAAQSNDTDTLKDIESKYYKDEDAFKSAYKSAIGDKLIAGEITEAEAQKLLERYYDADDAHWQIDRWNYKAQNGTTEGYAKYNDFYTAVETGQNLKSVIKEYTDNGVDKKTLASQITSHFKPIYTQASKAEKARLKGYLLNAYEVLGYNRKQKSKDIDAWG